MQDRLATNAIRGLMAIFFMRMAGS